MKSTRPKPEPAPKTPASAAPSPRPSNPYGKPPPGQLPRMIWQSVENALQAAERPIQADLFKRPLKEIDPAAVDRGARLLNPAGTAQDVFPALSFILDTLSRPVDDGEDFREALRLCGWFRNEDRITTARRLCRMITDRIPKN